MPSPPKLLHAAPAAGPLRRHATPPATRWPNRPRPHRRWSKRCRGMPTRRWRSAATTPSIRPRGCRPSRPLRPSRPARSANRTLPTRPAAATPPIGVNATIGSLDRVRADGGGQVLTTNQGVPIADNQNSLKAGLRGPALLEDFILREKITHFDHERIPERIVHARGSAAHGYFEAYALAGRATRAPRPLPKPASARRCSCASPPWPASAARPTPRATCAASPSSSTPTKATGTWSATTSRCSSSRTR